MTTDLRAPKIHADGWKLIEAAILGIEAHPDEYDQGVWDCGSARCFAGWIGHVSPFQPVEEVAEAYVLGDAGVDLLIKLHGVSEGAYEPDDTVNVGTLATLIVGLDSDDGGEFDEFLFQADLDWDMILSRVAAMAKRDGHTLSPDVLDVMLKNGVRPERLAAWTWDSDDTVMEEL